MKINRRLILLVSAPLTVAVAYSVLALAPAAQQTLQADRLTSMVQAADAATDLAYQLQRERAAATVLAADQGDSDDFRSRSAATDASISAFQDRTTGLSGVPGGSRGALERIQLFIEEIPGLRAQARSGAGTISALTFGYRIGIADLNNYRDGIAQADGVDADIADRIRAAAALSEASEHAAQQQVTVMRAQAAGGFTVASRRTFDGTRLGYTESVRSLYDLGPGEWRTWLERTLSGAKALEARRLEDRIGRTEVGADIDVTAQEWRKASADRRDLLRSVEERVDQAVIAKVSDARTVLVWTAVAEIALVVLTLIVVIIVAIRLGRAMIRRLSELRNAAHEVAHTGLPAVMSELSQPGALRGASPEDVARRTGDPVRITGEDEIGEVGEAFNSVHHEAVRLAAQQANARVQLAETLVSVARRGARMTAVMVSELDTVQRDEADPARMRTLFALDHLAIRMERNTNNLLVLGGYGNARVRPDDAGCSTVIMAAAQQIEQFERVSLGAIEAGIGITARAVHDVAHILAELLDNATRYSAPEKRVGVAVWRLWDRAVVQVVDEGIGIPADRRAVLNSALRAPETDIGDVRSMGLHVVARLAARHGIVVELRDSSGPGTIAEVTLPANVLAQNFQESPFGAEDVGRTRRPAPRQPVAVGAPPGPPDGPDHPREAARDTAAASRAPARSGGPVPSDPGPNPGSGPGEPASRIAGTSSAGLPLRQRKAPQQWPAAGKRSTAERRPGATADHSPRRRNSRQVSDVLAAYTQGINRSTLHRGRSTPDDTERTET
ncbi:nitrate- and nitrite sensing domain-containing protein [Streptomyces sp. NPDC049916]|uniref:sensor histidine kinase n=1 Tax=Streptomyces sp. NPDC049916 TaxID=3155156 RepID=UPI003413A142